MPKLINIIWCSLQQVWKRPRLHKFFWIFLKGREKKICHVTAWYVCNWAREREGERNRKSMKKGQMVIFWNNSTMQMEINFYWLIFSISLSHNKPILRDCISRLKQKRTILTKLYWKKYIFLPHLNAQRALKQQQKKIHFICIIKTNFYDSN